MEREVEALRVLLKQERSRIVREVRSLKNGWEEADGRARGFEQQALMLRCAEATLTREIGHADRLTEWWRKAESDSRKRSETLQLELKEARHANLQLRSDLDKCADAHTHHRPHTCTRAYSEMTRIMRRSDPVGPRADPDALRADPTNA